MTATLVAVVIVLAGVVVMQAFHTASMTAQAVDHAHAERRELIRAVIARSPRDFAAMDKVRAAGDAEVAKAEARKRSVAIDEEAYLRDLAAELEQGGYDPSAFVPARPEGL